MPGDADEKTEAPTPRRRMEARKRGQVARSQDLNGAVALLAGLVLIGWRGPDICLALLGVMKRSLGSLGPETWRSPQVYAAAAAVEAFRIIIPVFAVVAGALLVVVWAQVGWNLTAEPLMPRLSKLSPISGVKRLFSGRAVASLFTSIGKLLVVGTVAYLTVWENLDRMLLASTLAFENLFIAAARLVYQLGLRLVAALLILALIDFVYQRYRHEKDLKMTKQEVKDEFKSMDGDPVMKQRRRKVQMELAQQRLQRDVPNADMVITNPTHLAIALKYDPDTMPAPRVLAKGSDFVALRIRQIAQRCGVPIVERKALARMMYDEVEPGEYIPEQFYQAVAEVLAYVYRLTGRAPDGMRQSGAA